VLWNHEQWVLLEVSSHPNAMREHRNGAKHKLNLAMLSQKTPTKTQTVQTRLLALSINSKEI
jgi:hypothetical protein